MGVFLAREIGRGAKRATSLALLHCRFTDFYNGPLTVKCFVKTLAYFTELQCIESEFFQLCGKVHWCLLPENILYKARSLAICQSCMVSLCERRSLMQMISLYANPLLNLLELNSQKYKELFPASILRIARARLTPHGALLERELCRAMHTSSKSERICVKHRIIRIKSLSHTGVSGTGSIHRLRCWRWLHR